MNMRFIPILFYTLALFVFSAWGRKCYVKRPNTSNTPSSTTTDAPTAVAEPYVVDAQMFVQGYEWGPAVPKIIVQFEDKVSGFDNETFVIKTANSTRVILDAYNADLKGNKVSASNFVAFDLKVNTVFVEFINASFGDASPFSYDAITGLNSWAPEFELELDLAEGKSFTVGSFEYGSEHEFKTYTKNLMENYRTPETEVWEKDSFTSGKFTLQRTFFTPEGAKTDGVKNPLVIWLHGAGEGGDDTRIVLLGNEVVSLARDDIQKYFTTDKVKGAYVLAVQTPTMWMDKGNGQYNDDIDGERQYSIYEDALFAAIKDYVESNDDIDTSRIYLGGCSNGGYMTMNLMFEHGDYFTAFYPICEAYRDRNISDEMITRVKDYNIWFVQSEDDTTVDPLSFTIPSFYRLIKAGAKNVHFTLKDHVRGSDDPEALYFGHYAWTYAFNDNVKTEFDNAKVLDDFDNVVINGGNVTSTDNYVTAKNCNKEGNMWTWLASQTKN